MKKDDRLVPVITVVVYYGEKAVGRCGVSAWDAAYFRGNEAICQ